MYDQTNSNVLVPVYGPMFIPNKPEQGDRIVVSTDRFWTALEDVGIIEMRKLCEYRSMGDSSTVRDLKRWMKSSDKFSRAYYEITVLEPIPDRFDFFFRPSINMYDVGVPVEQL